MSKEKDSYTVVVGVSATSRSPIALAWAKDQAERRGGQVIAVRAYRMAATGPGTRPSSLSRSADAETRQELADLKADVTDVLGPDHGVRCRVVGGGRLKVLLQESEGADLLIIDAPRATNLLSPPLFANRVVYRASCPVVVMPPGVSGEPPTWLTRLPRTLGTNAVRAAKTTGKGRLPGSRKKR